MKLSLKIQSGMGGGGGGSYGAPAPSYNSGGGGGDGGKGGLFSGLKGGGGLFGGLGNKECDSTENNSYVFAPKGTGVLASCNCRCSARSHLN